MKIHFVCSGNTFRSRLAEAYLKSRNIPSLLVSSSGIRAQANFNGPICRYTAELLQDKGLTEYASPHWTQSTKEIIVSQDVLIFMGPEHYEFCKNDLGCNLNNHEIWNIDDMPKEYHGNQSKVDTFARETFEKIKNHVDEWLVRSKLV